MSLFCRTPKFSVCHECGVHFEPVQAGEHYPEFCKPHRAPKMERYARYQFVLAWAKDNWEKLEPAALEDERKTNVAAQAGIAQAISQMAMQNNAMRAAQQGGSGGYGLNPLGGQG